ncbi:hypothetical protein SAMN05444274_104196 [Mariniphaga anaerophila]|uniref:Probable membrane transporter protein n=1 Tax=Mariniphaga anaerophila TaxID=1484053 RepID=A0A1M5A5K4_9BACT|nr:sulfite exporter TauE/SafE family protein [Mariniphaga anaerophila]SHF25599.1 hypothetical protein SAMN05444274_104196 [Mariniphaga anaerophila]
MEWYVILALVVTGLIAGFINVNAGGGSMLILPVLMFIGLPANVANGTLRIAILFQNIIGVNAFRQKKVLNFKTDFRLVIPAVFGSVAGALIAVEMNVLLLEKIIAALMVVMFLMVVLKPGVWLAEHARVENPKPTVLQYILFFFIGFYGGFIQLGVGFFILAGLVLGCGHDLVRANAIKIFIVLIYTIVTIGIFMYNSQVNWYAGLALSAGNMAGAWLGVRFAVTKGTKYIRYVLIGSLVIVILNLFGVFG